MHYFLGIDIGGTKSHALIADETGRAVGFGQGGPGNHEVVGYSGLEAMLLDVTHQALAMAGIGIEQIAGAGLGVAGYDWPSELEPTLAAIRPLGLCAPLEVVNDTIIGLVAGSETWLGRGGDRRHQQQLLGLGRAPSRRQGHGQRLGLGRERRFRRISATR